MFKIEWSGIIIIITAKGKFESYILPDLSREEESMYSSLWKNDIWYTAPWWPRKTEISLFCVELSLYGFSRKKKQKQNGNKNECPGYMMQSWITRFFQEILREPVLTFNVATTTVYY